MGLKPSRKLIHIEDRSWGALVVIKQSKISAKHLNIALFPAEFLLKY